MRFGLRAAAAAVMFISLHAPYPSWGANSISANFDGVYGGQATVNPALSSGSCGPFSMGKVIISKGNLRTEAKPDMPWVTGFITDDGYVQGSMARPGGARSPLNGRLKDGTISAGFIESASMCAWLIELKRES
ncbi:MAG: hypothetical protein ACYCZX_12795 [Rhodospirillaceae bacterium]